MRAFSPDLRNPARAPSTSFLLAASSSCKTMGGQNSYFLQVKWYLGGGDNADNLAPVRGHQGVEGGNHGLGEAQPREEKYPDFVKRCCLKRKVKCFKSNCQPVILGQGFQKVLAQVWNLEAGSNSGNSLQLDVAEKGFNVEQEGKTLESGRDEGCW